VLAKFGSSFFPNYSCAGIFLLFIKMVHLTYLWANMFICDPHFSFSKMFWDIHDMLTFEFYWKMEMSIVIIWQKIGNVHFTSEQKFWSYKIYMWHIEMGDLHNCIP